jgi:hypothetical protein
VNRSFPFAWSLVYLAGRLLGGCEHVGGHLVSVMLMRNFARAGSAVEHEA